MEWRLLERKGSAAVWRAAAAVVVLAALVGTALAAEKVESPKPWAFAAIADNRRLSERPAGAYEGVLKEIREMSVNPEPKFPAIEFVIACGDLNNAADGQANWKLWNETFKDAPTKPCYYPLIGNWDIGEEAFHEKVILPAQKGVVGKDPANYYADWKNVRLIVSHDVKFVEKAITSAPDSIEHVFVADHYPVFPRIAHTEDGGQSGAEFWNTLVKHRGRVRAFFCGHTHSYSRMRVANPKGDAQDVGKFPDEKDGIYQVDCGNAGRSSHGNEATTVVEVLIDGKRVEFRVVQAANSAPTKFRVADGWKIGAGAGGK